MSQLFVLQKKCNSDFLTNCIGMCASNKNMLLLIA